MTSDAEKRARLLLEFIRQYPRQHGEDCGGPTLDEMRDAVGFCSRGHVSYYLETLEAEGLIVRQFNSPRSVRVVP